MKTFLCSIAVLFSPALSNAAVIFQYVAGEISAPVTPGSTVQVPLLLRETFSPEDSSVLESEGGLNAAGIKVSRVSGTAAITGIAANAAFDDSGPFLDFSDDGARLLEAKSSVSAYVAPASSAVGVSNVLLGTLTITVGSIVGESSVFRFLPFSAANGNTLTPLPNGYDLDIASSSPAYTGAGDVTPFELTITVVPEPAGFGIVGVLAGPALLRRRRRDVGASC